MGANGSDTEIRGLISDLLLNISEAVSADELRHLHVVGFGPQFLTRVNSAIEMLSSQMRGKEQEIRLLQTSELSKRQKDRTSREYIKDDSSLGGYTLATVQTRTCKWQS